MITSLEPAGLRDFWRYGVILTRCRKILLYGKIGEFRPDTPARGPMNFNTLKY